MRDELTGFIRRRGDEALAGLLTALALLQLALIETSLSDKVVSAVAAVVLGAAAARRSRDPLPLLTLMVVVSVVATVSPGFGGGTLTVFGLFLLLAVYSAAAHTSGRRSLVAGALTLAMVGINVVASGEYALGETLVFDGILFGAPWITGRAVRHRRLNEAELAEERARTATAIVAERAQIARELHDVVAHSISVMVLQARGGRRVLRTEPLDAEGAFAAIERTGEQALEEMRRLLGMLRRTDEAIELAPQPSLRALGGLVQEVEAAGLPVQVTVEGEPRDLPPGVDLSAFRIVQEGLTNTLKHAGPTRARVSLRYLPDELEVEVADDGRGTDGKAPSGYGLVGMRERVSVYGGNLEAGPRPEGGYSLRARLPIGSVRA